MTKPSDKITVYSYRRCPFAMRVRFTLHEKNIPFDVMEEDLKNFSPKLRAMHPEAKVPVLVHGDLVLYESAIITEYIEDAFPVGPKLLPEDPGERAEMRLWTYWCNQIFKPDLDRFKYGESRFKKEECVGVEERVKQHLSKLEKRLTSAEWLVGNSFSLADIHVFPFVRQVSRVKPEPSFMNDYRKVLDWCQKIEERPAFQKTIAK